MKWLVYGGKGWIGSQFVKLLSSNPSNEVILGRVRVDDYTMLLDEIMQHRPDRLICMIGRTSGPTCPNIDYLEDDDKLPLNLRDNLHAPVNLAILSTRLDIHLTYLGTGCIFEYDETHTIENQRGFLEQDRPNFTGSKYSAVKGVTDQLMDKFPKVLNLRIRMPISNENHPRNFITKIVNYSKVISIPNSMTVLPELLPIMADMAKRQLTGTFNMTNPGVIDHQRILELYQQYVDPTHKWTTISLDELFKLNLTKGKRSNNCMDASKLLSYYPDVLPIEQSVINVLKTYKLNN